MIDGRLVLTGMYMDQTSYLQPTNDKYIDIIEESNKIKNPYVFIKAKNVTN